MTIRLSLALQGGGAHGAFTWGVLDALLERGLPIAALSGASAGAINAALLAHGLAQGGTEDARAALETFWLATARSLPAAAHVAGDPPQWTPWARAWMSWAQWFTPNQLNPLGLNPLRELL